MKKFILVLVAAICYLGTTEAQEPNFEWRNATVYFVITDRFANGDTSNDMNYGRRVDYGSEQLNAATFHGGDFCGMQKMVDEGYFTALGVDVVWMTDVYEQIHGWMSGSGSVNDFPHYGYHGYYPLDYTQIDKNYGTVEEFRRLVDSLHAQGIRVMLGANLNNPGYPTLLDATQYGFAETGYEAHEAVEHITDWSYDSFFANRLTWNGWYDYSWVRMPNEEWDQNDPLEATLFGLPDFKDESNETVNIPEFLQRKWEMEGTDNDPWVNPSARHLRNNLNLSPSGYLIAWIASWVEEFGIDGFRCDIVENVHLDRWHELYNACNNALGRWRTAHPDDPAAQWNDNFYMTGDYDLATIDYKPDYAAAGFSSMVNFYFPKHGDLDAIIYLWQAYSDAINQHPNWHPFSYLNNSYHRDTDMNNMIDCATTLLLSPGVAQIFYGDETLRPLSDAQYNIDSDQAFRSDMNWESIDSVTLDHFRRLGTIRHDYPTVVGGRQEVIDTHTCARIKENDVAIIRVRPEECRSIPTGNYFANGDEVIDLYTGNRATVIDNSVCFASYENNVAIIVRANSMP